MRVCGDAHATDNDAVNDDDDDDEGSNVVRHATTVDLVRLWL